MEDEKLLSITSKIEEKLGKDTAAIIADDIGILITENAKTQKRLKSQDEEISSLKDRNDKLVTANGNLLQQIPMSSDDEDKRFEKQEVENKPSFNMRDAFDEYGNLKRF